MAERRHILIGGTGRAGTTLLVQLFTHLGFDTGYTPGEAVERVDPIAHAGLERMLTEPDLPHVVKSPHFADQIETALARGLQVETAVVPVRRLFDAAESRRQVYRRAAAAGLDAANHPGSLWKVTRPDDQEALLALQFYRFVEPLVAADVPVVFLSFPRFVEDAEYLYDRLSGLFTCHGVTESRVLEVHGRLVDRRLVNRFTAPAADV